jgi:hypothetical protein
VLAARLGRLAMGIRGLVVLGLALMLAVPLTVLWGPETLLRELLSGQTASVLAQLPEQLGLPLRARVVGAQLPALAAAALALWQLFCLFGRYRQGDVFSPAALQHLRRFAWSLVALAAAEPLSRMLASVALTLDNPPGQRLLALSLGSYDYALLLVALVFVAIARVMAEAARVADEHAQFV